MYLDSLYLDVAGIDSTALNKAQRHLIGLRE